MDCKLIKCIYYKNGGCIFEKGCFYVPIKPTDWKE